jgi:hypothetical protein
VSNPDELHVASIGVQATVDAEAVFAPLEYPIIVTLLPDAKVEVAFV